MGLSLPNSLVIPFVGIILRCYVIGSNANHLRSYNDGQKAERELEWIYGRQVICNNEWVTNYDEDEILKCDDNMGDSADKLRKTDVCYDVASDTYHRDNCLKPPDCSGRDGRGCKMKLCLNRVPIPNNENKFYVAIMKCIPEWENCDKCMCGGMKNGACRYSGQSVDDDRITIDCFDNLFTLFVDADQKADGSQCREGGRDSGGGGMTPSDSPSISPTLSPSGTPLPPEPVVLCPDSCGADWENIYWKDLSPCQKQNWILLGWDKDSWEDGSSGSDNYCLSKLDCFSVGAELAARKLCYDEATFYGPSCETERCSRAMNSFPGCCNE